MLTWDRAQQFCKDWTGDKSSTMLTNFQDMMNLGYKQILHTFGGEETEDVRTTSTQTGIRAIKLPPNYIRIHSAQATVGGKVYNLVEEESQQRWAERLYNNQTSTRPEVFFLRPRFGTGGTELLLDPIPSDTSTTITIYYAANARDLAIDKYTTGTVSVTGGASPSAIVNGSGTTFTTDMIGRFFKVNDETGDGNWYRITGFTSATSITLENKYDGNTVSGKNYIIAEAFNLPEDLQMGPVYYAMWHYYLGYRDSMDAKEIAKWETLYDKIYILAEKNYKTKSKSNTIEEKGRYSGFPTTNPTYFPDEVT